MYPNREYSDKDKVIVECDVCKSPYCKRKHVTKYKTYINNMERNGGLYICIYCMITVKYGVNLAFDTLTQEQKEEMYRKRTANHPAKHKPSTKPVVRRSGLTYKRSGKPNKGSKAYYEELWNWAASINKPQIVPPPPKEEEPEKNNV